MSNVLCLRPLADFERVGVQPPRSFEISYRGPSDPDVAELMKGAQALVIPAVGPKLSPELFQRTSLQLVQVTGAGVDRLDRDTLKRVGIPVSNVPGGSNGALAEYAVTAASVLLRRFVWANTEIRKGNYAAFRARLVADNPPGLEGLLVGIFGMGVIGQAVAAAFRKQGCRICYYDPAPRDPQTVAALDARSMSIEELLSSADVVTLHVPLLPETKGLIDDSKLSRMKAGAILIQASRGGVVDEQALGRHLASGHLGGAAVDVYSSEPPTSENPLFTLTGDAAERVLFTPHIAGVTRQSAAFLFRAAWSNVERVLVEKAPPLNRVY